MKVKEFHQAKVLRAKGFSLKEIAEKLGVAKSSVSLWVRNVALSDAAKTRLLTRIATGQYNAAESKKAKTREVERKYFEDAQKFIDSVTTTPAIARILCAAIYWCEGVKNPHYGVTFINSDPDVVRIFLKLLRLTFKIEEAKFKPLLHLHTYHNPDTEVDFWSKITHIKTSQFKKPYIKPNTGKRIRDGYRGCLSVRYYNADMARRLLAIGKAFFEKGA